MAWQTIKEVDAGLESKELFSKRISAVVGIMLAMRFSQRTGYLSPSPAIGTISYIHGQAPEEDHNRPVWVAVIEGI